jgi:hypothetical protein
VAEVLWAPALSAPLPAGGGGGAAEGGGGGALAAARRAMQVAEWRAAYGSLCADAAELGVPVSAIPRLPEDDGDVTLELVQARQAWLQGIVASFLSAGL